MSEQYPSDLTDGQWQVLRGLLPKQAKRGRRPICRRLILNAIMYVNRTGCQWRAMPHDFPKWKTVYTIFWRWRRDGIWERIHEALCRQVRKHSGKKPTPSVAIVDSQSIRTAEGGEERGYDAGKKITGRKRHLAVDTWDWFGRWSCMEPIGKITMEPASCFRSSESSVACESSLPIVPTAGTVCLSGLRKPLDGFFKRCCGRWEQKALSYCRSGGSSNARLPGWPATADTARIMSAVPNPVKR